MYRAIAKNKRNTVFIILFFLAIIGGLGWLAAYIYNDLTIVVVTLANGGGVTSFGILIGVIFTALGAGRLYLSLRKPG